MGNWHVPTAAAAFGIVLSSSYSATIKLQCIAHFFFSVDEEMDFFTQPMRLLKERFSNDFDKHYGGAKVITMQ